MPSVSLTAERRRVGLLLAWTLTAPSFLLLALSSGSRSTRFSCMSGLGAGVLGGGGSSHITAGKSGLLGWGGGFEGDGLELLGIWGLMS